MNTQISSSSTDASPQVALPAFSPTGVIHSGLITVEVVEPGDVIHSGLITVEVVEPGDTESPHVSTQIRSVEMRWIALNCETNLKRP